MKLAVLVLVVLVAAVATLPMWGSCDLNAKACSAWCSMRHFDSDLKAARCKADCSSKQLACLARSGVKAVDKFMSGEGR